MQDSPPRKRANEINQKLFSVQKDIYRLRRLPSKEANAPSYIITIKKQAEVSLQKQIEQYNYFFNDVLLHHETLSTVNKCFAIRSDEYEITYCIEAFRKNAERIGHFETEGVQTTLIKRMGCEKAFRWMKRNGITKHDEHIVNLMSSADLKKCYPNPADRFVACINDYKQQLKMLGVHFEA